MKITISILLLFVCFGCKIRENKAGSTYKAKSITVKSKGTIGSMYDSDTGTILINGDGGGGVGMIKVISADGHFYDSAITIVGDKNDGQTKGVASFNADDFNCDSGIVIDYDDYAKDTPVTGCLSSEDFKRFVSKQKNNTVIGSATTIIYSEHYTPRFETAHQYDTQKVIMLVCDTSIKTGFYEMYIFRNDNDSTQNVGESIYHVPYVYWQYGYEVRDKKGVVNEHNITIDTHGNVVPDIVYETAGYLNADKKPLSKSIIVWQTKELK